LVNIQLQLLIEIRVLTSSNNDPSGDRVIRVVGEGEFGTDILIVIDAYVVYVPSIMNKDFQHAREANISFIVTRIAAKCG